jgi:hypothetical protein
MTDAQQAAGESVVPNFPPLTANQLAQMNGQEPVAAAPIATAPVAQPTIAPAAPIAPIVVNKVSAAPIAAPNPYLPVAGAPKAAAPVVVPQASAPQAAAPEISAPPVVAAAPVTKPTYEPVLAEAEEPITSQVPLLFTPSTSLTAEPQTASIIIDSVDPLQNLSIAISETGEMLKTGSIELPTFNNTNTGEIATILDAEAVDEAIAQDSMAGYVSTIAPMRASGVVNTSGKIGIMPSRAAKGQGQVFAMVAVSVIMVTIGGLVLAAFMLGFLK